MRPSQRELVGRGTTVTIRVGCGCTVSSLGLPPGRLHSYDVPNFLGRGALAAIAWARGKLIVIKLYLGALREADAPTLIENYVIVRQRPSRNRQVAFARRTSNGGIFVTPITLWTRQGTAGLNDAGVTSRRSSGFEGIDRAIIAGLLFVAAVGMVAFLARHRTRSPRRAVGIRAGSSRLHGNHD